MTDLKFQWGPHVYIGEASDELVNILIEKGKEVRKPEFDASHILAGKLKEEYMYQDWNEWFVPLFHEHIVNYITTLGSGASKHVATTSKSFEWELKNLWVNYQGPKEYNPPHNHSGDLSFVIYPDIPQELLDENESKKNIGSVDVNRALPGNIIFEYGDRIYNGFMSFCNTTRALMPHTGLIVIFPAHLTHYAHAFESDVERVSVSGNIVFNYEGSIRQLHP